MQKHAANAGSAASSDDLFAAVVSGIFAIVLLAALATCQMDRPGTALLSLIAVIFCVFAARCAGQYRASLTKVNRGRNA